jgi:hypothetical protein
MPDRSEPYPDLPPHWREYARVTPKLLDEPDITAEEARRIANDAQDHPHLRSIERAWLNRCMRKIRRASERGDTRIYPSYWPGVKRNIVGPHLAHKGFRVTHDMGFFCIEW